MTFRNKFHRFSQQVIILHIQENIALAPLTTLKIGGVARLFVKAETENDVTEAFQFADENEFDIFVLGGGSNVLIADEGYDGLVLQIALKGISRHENSVTVAAGEDWDAFVKFCVDNDLQGVECLSGIPGTVGGTPVQNVGAYGQEVAETISVVRVFDRKSKQILELSNAECKFVYRSSIFNTTDKNRFIVLSVTYNLIENGAPKIVYKDLREFFVGIEPNLQAVREAVLEIRRRKSMVIDGADANSRSAGSFFKNPVISNENFNELKTTFAGEIPNFTVDGNSVKIPAAWLIENSGFCKGFVKGNAGLSTKHTLAVINRGAATAAEIISLTEEIQTAVHRKFGIELHPEPIFTGFKNN